MTIGQVLLDRKIIRKKDFLQFEKLMYEKYGLSPRNIFSGQPHISAKQ